MESGELPWFEFFNVLAEVGEIAETMERNQTSAEYHLEHCQSSVQQRRGEHGFAVEAV